jgi:hypothetical protein
MRFDISNCRPRWGAIATAATLVCAAPLAQADLTQTPATAPAWAWANGAVTAPGAGGSLFATGLAATGNMSTATNLASTSPTASDPLSRAQSASTTPGSRLSFLTAPNLWSFVISIRAQQQGQSFALLQTHVTILRLVDGPSVATVPLPAAGWLLAAGLFGLAGAGLKKRRSRRALSL